MTARTPTSPPVIESEIPHYVKPLSAEEIAVWERSAVDRTVFNWDLIRRAIATIRGRDAEIARLREAIELLDAECERRQQDVSELSAECERWHDEVASMDHARDCKGYTAMDGACNCARALLPSPSPGEMK